MSFLANLRIPGDAYQSMSVHCRGTRSKLLMALENRIQNPIPAIM